MARLNTAPKYPAETTHEGAIAARISSLQALKRSVLSCLLWEDEFYEDGEKIAERIVRLVGEVDQVNAALLAVQARTEFNLRHVPLLMLSAMAKHRTLHWETVAKVIQRADELSELLAIHAKVNKVTPDNVKAKIPAQMKRGLAAAFRKFDEYQLSKYDRAGAIRLRDVLFLCHAEPQDEAQDALWKRLVENKLAVPDTWEVALSGGADKKEAFTRLLNEKNLGYFALLRNLRNMVNAGVHPDLIREAIIARRNGAHRVLPFRYVAAARACPSMEPAIDQALCEAVSTSPAFDGRTLVLVDVSGSMNDKLSARSDMTRMDAAAALASMINGDRRVFTFSNSVVEVPPRFGMAGVDAIVQSQQHGGTELFMALRHVTGTFPHDRIIVITDEQAFGYGSQRDQMPAPVCKRAYVINVASARNGVGYGKWTHIDGFSEGVLRYIHDAEFEPPPASDMRAMG